MAGEKMQDPVYAALSFGPGVIKEVAPIGKGIGKIWHITLPEYADDILRSGFRPEKSLSPRGDIWVSVNRKSVEGMLRSLRRMNSFETVDDVFNWAQKQGISQKYLDEFAEMYKGMNVNPQETYLNLLAEFGRFPTQKPGPNLLQIPPNENLWRDFAKKFIGRNPVLLEGELAGGIPKEYLFQTQPEFAAAEAGMHIEPHHLQGIKNIKEIEVKAPYYKQSEIRVINVGEDKYNVWTTRKGTQEALGAWSRTSKKGISGKQLEDWIEKVRNTSEDVILEGKVGRIPKGFKPSRVSGTKLSKFANEIEESLVDYLEPSTLKAQENWVYNNNWKSLQKYAKDVSENIAHYDALQENLIRIGFPEQVKVYKGVTKGRKAFEQSEFTNATLDKRIAENYRKALGVPESAWTVEERIISRSDIIGHGHPQELEVIIKQAKSGKIEL